MQKSYRVSRVRYFTPQISLPNCLQIQNLATFYYPEPPFSTRSGYSPRLAREFRCLSTSENFGKTDIEGVPRIMLAHLVNQRSVFDFASLAKQSPGEGTRGGTLNRLNFKGEQSFPLLDQISPENPYLSNIIDAAQVGSAPVQRRTFTSKSRSSLDAKRLCAAGVNFTGGSARFRPKHPQFVTSPEMSEQNMLFTPNLRSRNILRFLFTIIILHDNLDQSATGGLRPRKPLKNHVLGSAPPDASQPEHRRNLLSQNLFSHGFRMLCNLRLFVDIVKKPNKISLGKKSKRNFIWASLTILTILGFPVVLGFTMRLTTSGRVQSPRELSIGLSTSISQNGAKVTEYPTGADFKKKSHLFNGLVASPKFNLNSRWVSGAPLQSPFTHVQVDFSESEDVKWLSPCVATGDFHFARSSIAPASENMLRLPEYLSKLFIIWGLLYIWKGVRPQRKTLKDFHSDGIARVIWPNRPSGGLRRFLRDTSSKSTFKIQKGAFSSLQGLDAFLPVLQSLIQSLTQHRTQRLLGIPKTYLGIKPFSEFQGRHPKGYLFVGPPGTGKTLLAQALASEAQVPLLCLSASEIQKQIEIGTRIGALRLRRLFDQARRLAPCILFLDEIDAIGKYRGGVTSNFNSGGEALSPPDSNSSQNANTGSGKSSDLKLFTEFLIQMDECKGPGTSDGFVVIGTTNFLSNLDSAFIRSGRFDRILGLNYPAKKVRVDILKWYCGEKASERLHHSLGVLGAPVASPHLELSEQKIGMAWNYFGYYTNQYSPADLARLVNESLLYQITCSQNPFQVKSRQIHSFESLQKGFNRIQSHKKDLSGGGESPPLKTKGLCRSIY